YDAAKIGLLVKNKKNHSMACFPIKNIHRKKTVFSHFRYSQYLPAKYNLTHLITVITVK
ncbi:MAG: hypothetical protein ACI892_002429, partial [Marinobacter maritimus]